MRQALRLISIAALVLPASGALAETVRLAGSPAVIAAVINPNRAAIERATGDTLEVVSTETGQGLADLADRKADVAMVSERIDAALLAAERAGRKLHRSALWVHELQTDEVVFLVHASNPVARLSMVQLSDIHTGRITNWKQLGGKDRAITVYTGSLTGGAGYAGGVRSSTSVIAVADLVQGDESAIGAVGKGLVKPGAATRTIETPRVTRQLSLITVGAPSPKASRAIEALKRAAAAGQLPRETVLVAQ